MKNSILFLCLVLISSFSFSQNLVFHENFEAPLYGDSVTSSQTSTNVDHWGINSNLYFLGSFSDSCQVVQGDTTYLTTDAFSTVGKSYVVLDFDHICKVEWFDGAEIQVSNNNGTTWTSLQATEYYGSSQFGGKFTSVSYGTLWNAGVDSIIPTNSWWQHEKFDISTIVGNSSQVKIRFLLRDGDNDGPIGLNGINYGWILDNIIVTASISELIPPTITYLAPFVQDTIVTTSPYIIKAKIEDASGIDTAYIAYTVNSSIIDTVPMTIISGDTFSGNIPFYGYGRTILYNVIAIDGSSAANISINPAVGSKMIYAKQFSQGTYIIGTGMLEDDNYGPIYRSSATSSFDYCRHSYLFKQSELAAVGIPSGGQITKVEWYKVTEFTTLGNALFQIYMKNSNTNSLTTNTPWTSITSTSTQVYNTTSQTIPVDTGWIPFPVSGFAYSGQSMEISTNWDISAIAGNPVTGKFRWRYADGFSSDVTIGAAANNTSNLTTLNTGSYGGTKRPNIRITVTLPNSLTEDAGVISILPPSSGISANTNFNTNVIIKNFGIDTLTSLNVKWTLNDTSQTTVNWTGTLLPDSTANITLGSLNLSAGLYTIKSWTDNPNGVLDMNIVNDSSEYSFYACVSALSGIKTIGGTTADYPNFKAAALALNQCGINGTVAFNVASGSYNEQIEIENVSGSSATNTITFKSTSGDSSSVILTNNASDNSSNYTLRLNGASHITFQDITIQATDSTFGRVIEILDGVHDLNFSNNIIKTLDSTSGVTNQTMALISTTDSVGNNININNNSFINGSFAIHLIGEGSYSSGWDISNNIINGYNYSAVEVMNAASVNVSSNEISSSPTANMDDHKGIYLIQNSGSPTIIRNKIYAKGGLNTQAISLSDCALDSLSPGLIANNFAQANGSSGQVCGILIHNTKHCYLYYNSTNVLGNSTNSGSLILLDDGTIPTQNIVIVNNIFANNSGGSAVITSGVDTSDFTNDYNDLFTFGASKYADINGTSVVDLATWKIESGEATHSVSINPYFSSSINLHTTNNLMNGTGMSISGITSDIDGDTRNTITPDIGADEFIPSPIDIACLEILSPFSGCGLDTNELVSIRIKNAGTATVNTGFTASYQINNNTVITESLSNTILSGDTLDYSFNTKVNLNVLSLMADSTFEMKAWVKLTTDPIAYNDTAYSSVESKYKPIAPVVSDTTISYGNSVTLTAQHTDTILYWYPYDTSSVEIHSGQYFTTPALYDTTDYWVSVGAAKAFLDSVQPGQYSNTYTSVTNIRGYHFQAPVDFVILGLKVPTTVGTDPQSVEVLQFSSAPSGSPQPHTLLFYAGMVPGSDYIPCNIPIAAGDYISIHGTRGIGTHKNSYSPASIISIYGMNASLSRSYTNSASLYTNSTLSGNIIRLSSGNIGQVDFLYGKKGSGCESDRMPIRVNIIGFPAEDAGISQIINPVGNICSSSQEIKFEIKNSGFDTLQTANIKWSLNGVLQDSIVWSGSLLKDSTDIVIADTLLFSGGIYCIDAWTTLPNGIQDTINANDTIHACITVSMMGNYTIGDTTGGVYDYPNFNAAKDALVANGICGNVTFLVDTGYYEERLVLPNIAGSGPNARITFTSMSGDSTDVTLHYTLNSIITSVVQITGNYYTFRNLTLSSLGGNSFGRVVELVNTAQYNEILNCVILGTVTTTSTNNFSAIYAYGGYIDYNAVKNNLISNGAYPIYFYGSSSNMHKGNVFEANVIQGFYHYGPYFYRQDSLNFNNNYIENDTSATVYGARFYYSSYINITKNRIVVHGTGSHYGLDIYYCLGTTTNPSIVANNFITLNGTGNGTWHGLYIGRDQNMNIYNNSILLTGGSAANGRCIYQTLGVNNNIVNNILSNTGGGYAYYVNTPNAVPTSDYNCMYSSGNNLAYWTGARANLNALQTASGKEAHSVSVVPSFTSTTDLHLSNSNLNGLGLALAEVTDDIDGDLRSPFPTIGADEVPAIAIDLGILDIIIPSANSILTETTNSSVSVVVSNFGTDTIFTINIQYSVNNATPVSIVYNDTLFSFESDTVVMPNFIVPAGNSNICAKTIVTGDLNTFNDEFCQPFFGMPVNDAYLTKIIEINGGCGLASDTVKIWINNLGVDTINGSTPSTITAYYQLNASSAISQNMALTINPGDSGLFVFNTLANFTVTTSDSLFNIVAWVDLLGDNVSYNDTAYSAVYSYHTPTDPIASNVSIPYATPVTLTAISPTNDSIHWYDETVGGNLIEQGNSYTTPLMYASDTVYVQALAGDADIKITEVSQHHLNGNGATNPSPSWLSSGDDFVEITNLGLSSVNLTGYKYHREGYGNINYSLPSIVLDPGEVLVLSTYGTSIASPANNFYIAGNSSVVTNNPTGSWITDPNNKVIDAVAVNGHYFSIGSNVSLSDWSGSSISLSGHAGIVRIISDNNNASDWSLSGYTNHTLGSLNASLNTGNSGGGCSSNRVPVVITVGNQSACDVGIYAITQPISSAYLSNNETISVHVNNYGTIAQTNIPVNYQVNNGIIITDTITSTILPNDSLVYTFGTTSDFSIINNIYQIKAWTSLSCDNVQLNDTSWNSVKNMIATYCLSMATTTTDLDIKNVSFNSINNTSPSPYNARYTNYTNTTPAVIKRGNFYPISINITSTYSWVSEGYVEVYIDYNRDGLYDEPTETAFGAVVSGVSSATTVTVAGNINVPAGLSSGLTGMRVVVIENANTTGDIHPCGTYNSGETEDYAVMLVPNIANDASVVSILEPTTISLNASTSIKAIIANYGADSITSVDVSYEVNSGTPITQTWTGLLHNGDIDTVVFIAATLSIGQNNICVYTSLPNDSNISNDQKCVNSYREVLTTAPYTDDFESVDYWLPDTIINQWERGVPSATNINTAHSPTNVWMIDLDSTYANNSNEYLYTPKFYHTIAALDSMKFWHYYNTQNNADGCFIQYTTSTGYWSTLGTMINDTNGVNWYNTSSGGYFVWSGNSQGWVKSSYSLSSITNLASPAQFRFVFVSNASNNNFDGWAIDDFEITIPKLPKDAGVTNIITPVDSTKTGSNVIVQLTLQNYGTDTLTTIPVIYAVTGQTATTETWTGSLLPDSNVNYTFTTTYTGPNTIYELCAWTSLINDTYTNNDSTCKNISTIAAPDDVGIIEIISPDSITYIGSNVTVTAKIQNFGTNTVTSIPVEYEYGINPIQATWTGTLLPNATENYTFTTTYFSPIGTYLLCVSTKLSGDADSTNNEKCKSIITGIKKYSKVGFILFQNVPNPTKGITTIGYIVPKAGKIRFEVINLLGKTIYSENNNVLSGKHQIDLDVNNLPAGIYYYSIIFDGERLVKKMIKN